MAKVNPVRRVCRVNLPQPFQYQGSKRSLAPAILGFMPTKFRRMVEPFAGSAAMTIACAARNRAERFWINDLNRPLADLLNLIINRPEEIADHYADLWLDNADDALGHYYTVRESFNRTQDPKPFLYLLARCIKGAVRYNADGLFNQSPDKRRLGTRPATMRQNIMAASQLLRGRTVVTSHDFRDVLAAVEDGDVVYMDPPYQGTSGERDGRYLAGLSFDQFVASLDGLNSRGLRYLISYDGRTGDKTYGEPLPTYLDLALVELEAGRSTQATLLGREEQTVESLYLSPALAAELPAAPRVIKRRQEQTVLF
ncbi:MAG: DNA adenine methylase [Opitutaceae bacterium]|nr:DNA adenine methylase [Opitutaceae bacterium]